MWLFECVLFDMSKKNLGSFQARQEAEICYVDCSHIYKISPGVMIGGRRPSVEEDLRWKTTFGGRQRSVEDDLLWKTTFGRRGPSEDLAFCLLRFTAFCNSYPTCIYKIQMWR